MRLTLIISSLSTGGAERVMSIMTNYWAKKGWEITILTFDDGTKPPFYDLDPRIHHLPLDISRDSTSYFRKIWNNLKRIQILRSAVANSQPDAIVSFLDQTNILTLLATRWLNVPVIISERTVPAVYSIGKCWSQLRLWTYPLADWIVVQTKETLNCFSPKLQVRTCIIPNPVLLPTEAKPTIDKLSVENTETTRKLIAMGRLTQEKGFDLLLQAFAPLKNLYPEWALTILGEGPSRSELEALRDKLELSDRVHFIGAVKNPYKFLMQADLFVMSSRFEGFPNALCEAMACGLPVISTDCPGGPREIIRDGVDGILVRSEDIEALAVGLNRLMADERERKRLAACAIEVVERFSLEKVMGMWENLLGKVVEKNYD